MILDLMIPDHLSSSFAQETPHAHCLKEEWIYKLKGYGGLFLYFASKTPCKANLVNFGGPNLKTASRNSIFQEDLKGFEHAGFH